MRKRRQLIALVVLAAAAAGAAAWLLARPAGPRDWVAGTYISAAPVAAGATTLRLSPDGSLAWEHTPAGAAVPSARVAGRWRLSGRVLVFDERAGAAAPVGLLQRIAERYQDPVLMSGVYNHRVVSADAAGLVLDLGGVLLELKRVADTP